LLFGSGCCALIYQVGWLREFRLIFGASTAASAAVLAIFIGGLGIGGLVLGSRADAHPRPILFYAQLETVVAVSAALTPLLLSLARTLYIAAGGTSRVGMIAGTVARLILSALVLAVPTLAMGGTLPAAARGVTRGRDVGRHGVAILYGINTVGAVLGCFGATFILLELFGTRQTLWLAAGVNLLVAMLARQLDRSIDDAGPDAAPAPDARESSAPAAFVLMASGTVGFAFFLMELVWYRMLSPLLGGSVFTFGLILAVALIGIAAGGLLYALGSEERPATLSAFAWSCLLEAATMAVPFALGDRLAVLALVLQPLGHASFGAQIVGWTELTLVVVLAPAIVAGYQFPLLIALLGRGPKHVGRQIGLTYVTNTIGAILGSLAGGFGLLPWLSAPGAWRFAGGSLLVLGAAAIWLTARREKHLPLPQIVVAALAVAMLAVTGPTAVWRHTGIGAGRALTTISSTNQLRDWMNAQRRAVVWQGDGVESSIALSKDLAGYVFVVNGKADGNARSDAGTQVMNGLIGAILHGHVKRSLVVGLGTGSTAGWLGAIPQMERVDVVELEPLILDVARDCKPVNHDVMNNPKVHITIGDAREALLTTQERYDLIASEPSNPFRAGVASLFTREYYAAATGRLNPDGLFVQWVQAYDIDTRTLRTLYATMASVFPSVETWQTSLGDLVLIGGLKAHPYRTRELAARIAEEPYRSALRDVWRSVDLQGFFSHFVAGDAVARAIASAPDVELNTDDRNVVEFGFARTLGLGTSVVSARDRALAAQLGAARPPLDDPSSINWAAVDTAWIAYQTSEGITGSLGPLGAEGDPETSRRSALVQFFVRNDTLAARQAWAQHPDMPRDPSEWAMAAAIATDTGSEEAPALIERVRQDSPGSAAALTASAHARAGRLDDAAAALETAFAEFRKDPWPLLRFKQRALDLAGDIGMKSPALAQRMMTALKDPFAVLATDEVRLLTIASLTRAADFPALCRGAIAPLEVSVPWTHGFLELRRTCYASSNDPRADEATRDLLEFALHEPLPLETGIGAAPRR
jgi:spermidine synthase